MVQYDAWAGNMWKSAHVGQFCWFESHRGYISCMVIYHVWYRTSLGRYNNQDRESGQVCTDKPAEWVGIGS